MTSVRAVQEVLEEQNEKDNYGHDNGAIDRPSPVEVKPSSRSIWFVRVLHAAALPSLNRYAELLFTLAVGLLDGLRTRP